MANAYPIRVVAHMTRIPLDTLRAWERRYGAVAPGRTKRGRMYSEQQVERLVLLRTAVEQGHPIGQVARVPDKELQNLLGGRSKVASEQMERRKSGSAHLYAPVLNAIIRYDYAAADRELNRLAAALGNPKELVLQVALPLMREVGNAWHERRLQIAQEHMLTSLLSALLSSFIRIYTPSNPPASVLFATPRGERHGFPILAAALFTVNSGLGIIHLGTDLPGDEIIEAARKSQADAVLLSLSNTLTEEVVQELGRIRSKLKKHTALWLGASPETLAERPFKSSGWKTLQDFESLGKELSVLGGNP